jgi:hypothetical protein
VIRVEVVEVIAVGAAKVISLEVGWSSLVNERDAPDLMPLAASGDGATGSATPRPFRGALLRGIGCATCEWRLDVLG